MKFSVVGEQIISVRCFQILLAEAGRAGFLIVLEGSIAIVLVACPSQCNQHKAGNYSEDGGDVHFCVWQTFAVERVWLQV